MATRKASGKVLNAVAGRIPWLIGGSADLAPSTNTLIEAAESGHFRQRQSRWPQSPFWDSRTCHGSSSQWHGALSGLRPYVATFFVFSDYLRPAMRLASIMQQPVLYIFTHDSIGLGEDGPTHQPIEHLAACRSIPGLVVIRPGDAERLPRLTERRLSINDRPVALVLTRQGLPTLARSQHGYGVEQGGLYPLPVGPRRSGANPHRHGQRGAGWRRSVRAARERPAVPACWCSMPWWELFEMQPDAVSRPGVACRQSRHALRWKPESSKAGRVTLAWAVHWYEYVWGIGPLRKLYEHFGITAANVVGGGEMI